MSNVRRGLLLGVLALLVGVFVRLRAKGEVEVEPTTGAWRALEGPDFR